MNIGIKVSKENHDADSPIQGNIIFDSERGTHPVFSINDYAVSSPIDVAHGVGFFPKIWVNVLGTTDTRVPVEDALAQGIDYEISNRRFHVEDDFSTTRTVRVIVFAKDISNV